MKILVNLWDWILIRISPHHPGQPDLLTAVKNSFREWQYSKDQFNFVDPELIDYMVYRLNASERHYMALLALARNEGVKAWPNNLKPEVRINKELS